LEEDLCLKQGFTLLVRLSGYPNSKLYVSTAPLSPSYLYSSEQQKNQNKTRNLS